MDSFESRMNPRFLSESEKGMLWESRVIEWGRETVEGFKEDEKGKRRAVLSSCSVSWFSVIHVFMWSAHALSPLVRLVTSLSSPWSEDCHRQTSVEKAMTWQTNLIYAPFLTFHFYPKSLKKSLSTNFSPISKKTTSATPFNQPIEQDTAPRPFCFVL